MPLRVWFEALWHVTSQKGGTSALGLQRVLGLGSYRTAWTLLHKLRRAMVRPGRERLQGMVEVDEIFIGGPKPGKRGRGVPIPMKPPVCNGMIAPRDSWMMPPPCNEMIPPGALRLLAE